MSEALGVTKIALLWIYVDCTKYNHTQIPIDQRMHIQNASRTHSKAKGQMTRWLVRIGQLLPRCTQTE